MSAQPGESESAVCFSKAFFGIYGPDARNRCRAIPGKVDHHRTRCYGTGDHRICVVGESGPTINATQRFLGPEMVAIKGRPFALDDTGAQFFDPESDFDRVLVGLDGKFSIGALCATGLILATDVIGAGPVYYALRGNRIFYGTHLGLLLWLLDEAPECNRVGAAAILIARGQIGKETPFRGIFRLQAGERLVARAADHELRWSLGRYADLADLMSSDVSPGGAPVHDFGALLESSLARERYPSGTALMLSGGRDSKAIAFASPRRDIEAITYGMPEATDLRRGKLLAARLDLKHRQVPYNSWSYGDFAAQVVGLHAGASGLQTAHNIVGFQWAAGQGVRLAIVGFLGDAITGAHLGTMEHVSERHRRRILCSNLDPIDVELRDFFAEEVDRLLAAIENRRDMLSGLTAVQMLMVEDWTIRQACWISTTFDLAEWYCDVSYPFFYRPLMKFMFNRPFSDLRGQSLYDGWLRSAQLAAGIGPVGPRDMLMNACATGRSIMRTGRRPVERLYWPDATERSRQWLEQLLVAGTGPFQEISRRSYRYALEKRQNRIPTFLHSLPLMMALDLRQHGGLLAGS